MWLCKEILEDFTLKFVYIKNVESFVTARLSVYFFSNPSVYDLIEILIFDSNLYMYIFIYTFHFRYK